MCMDIKKLDTTSPYNNSRIICAKLQFYGYIETETITLQIKAVNLHVYGYITNLTLDIQ